MGCCSLLSHPRDRCWGKMLIFVCQRTRCLEECMVILSMDVPPNCSASKWVSGRLVQITSHLTRWCFQIFLYVHPILSDIINFDSYFSNGLVQPPASLTHPKWWTQKQRWEAFTKWLLMVVQLNYCQAFKHQSNITISGLSICERP